MNQYNQNQKNKTNSPRTGPEFDKEKEMDFYVPVGAILIELKDCSYKAAGAEVESKILGYDAIDPSKSSAIIEQLISSILANGRRRN